MQGVEMDWAGIARSGNRAGVQTVNSETKVPVLLTKHHAMEAYWGSGGIAPLILWPRH
jgi:hypothetical protein